MTDRPIAIVGGRAIYDNAPTTVFVIAFNVARELLMIQRARQPGYGLLGLPGGYQMRGETWQEAGAREVLEETGCHLLPTSLLLVSIRTDEYWNNLIICRSSTPVKIERRGDNEALAVLFSNQIGVSNDWAHRDLYEAAASFVAETNRIG